MGRPGAVLTPPRALIVSMSLRPGILRRVALQQSPLPLPRLLLSCDDTLVEARLLQRTAICPFFPGLTKHPHSMLSHPRGSLQALHSVPDFPVPTFL